MSVLTRNNNNTGYVALISVLFISISLLILTMAISFEGYHSRYSIFESQQKEQSLYLAEACINTAILELSQDLTYDVDNLTVPVGNERECRIVSIAQGLFPTRREIEAQGISGEAVTNIFVEANFANLPDVTIILWQEVANF